LEVSEVVEAPVTEVEEPSKPAQNAAKTTLPDQKNDQRILIKSKAAISFTPLPFTSSKDIRFSVSSTGKACQLKRF